MRLLLLICLCFFLQQKTIAQINPLVRSTTAASGTSKIVVSGNKTYVVQQSIGQPSSIGTHNNNDYIIRQGFIQPNVLTKIQDKNIPLSLKLIVYPNPFKENIYLSFDEEIRGNIDLTVYDMLGRQMFIKSYPPNQKVSVILGWLSLGEYILKVRANQKQFIAKIIKE